MLDQILGLALWLGNLGVPLFEVLLHLAQLSFETGDLSLQSPCLLRESRLVEYVFVILSGPGGPLSVSLEVLDSFRLPYRVVLQVISVETLPVDHLDSLGPVGLWRSYRRLAVRVLVQNRSLLVYRSFVLLQLDSVGPVGLVHLVARPHGVDSLSLPAGQESLLVNPLSGNHFDVVDHSLGREVLRSGH